MKQTSEFRRYGRLSKLALILPLAAGPLAAGVWLPPALRAAENAAAADEDHQIARLIADLGDNRFVVRQRAQRELTRQGAAAFDALSAAEDSDDVEIATQARYLVRLIRVEWIQESDSPRVKERLQNYELSDERDRLERLKSLASLPADQGLGALCRIARFEPSHVLSKHAAALILRSGPPPDGDWTKRGRTILSAVDRSTRAAAYWLRTYVRAHDDPAGALADWRQATAVEQDTLEHHPQFTQTGLLEELLKQQVDVLDRLDRTEEAAATVRRIVELERGESESLADLVEWLARRRDWKAIEQVVARFETSLSIEPELLYTLAQAWQTAGKADRASETARKALALNPDKPVEHLMVARALQIKGLIEWANGEYRYVIGLGWGNGAAEAGLRARYLLADNLHDVQQDKEAAQVLKEAVDKMDTDVAVLRFAQQVPSRSPDSVRSKMYYLFAEDRRRQGDATEALGLLEKALAEDNTDIDVLISMYRLPLDADRRKKLRENIRQVVDEERRQTQQNPLDPNHYNQLAWLVANTEGDVDEAIRMSHKSIDLMRAAGYLQIGGFLDTLAHCYYAKRDYASAVKYQTEAAQLDPSSAAITRQLKVFQAALAEQQAKEREDGAKNAKQPGAAKPAAPAGDAAP